VTSHHSEKKNLKNNGEKIWVWMAILKPQINGKIFEKRKKTTY